METSHVVTAFFPWSDPDQPHSTPAVSHTPAPPRRPHNLQIPMRQTTLVPLQEGIQGGSVRRRTPANPNMKGTPKGPGSRAATKPSPLRHANDTRPPDYGALYRHLQSQARMETSHNRVIIPSIAELLISPPHAEQPAPTLAHIRDYLEAISRATPWAGTMNGTDDRPP